MQWENISYCLSQLSFTEKGVKKLIESFKTYEHALSEDSVMDHFRNIINKVPFCFFEFSGLYFQLRSDYPFSLHIGCKQGKKFAKPELKVCIEEFEEKLNKFHMEKKEQEVTARNAEIHRQKVGNLEGFVMAGNNGEESAESDIAEGWFMNFNYVPVALSNILLLPLYYYFFLYL